MRHKFLVTILTHQRPENVLTYKALRKFGYTGKILLLIDNEDPTIDEYRKIYKDEEIHVFDKEAEDRITDNCDNLPHRKTALYARNASFQIVKDLGYRYFIQLDDDYREFRHSIAPGSMFKKKAVKDLDAVFDAYLDFYIASNAKSITMALGGDYVGGQDCQGIRNGWHKRKCMNSWFCDTEKPLRFTGHMNDDCSQYVVNGRRGDFYLQCFFTKITMAPSQSMGGGMTGLYKDSGTYMKTMYTIIQAPSCVRISAIGSRGMGNSMDDNSVRIHHKVKWNNACVKIVREKWKK